MTENYFFIIEYLSALFYQTYIDKTQSAFWKYSGTKNSAGVLTQKEEILRVEWIEAQSTRYIPATCYTVYK